MCNLVVVLPVFVLILSLSSSPSHCNPSIRGGSDCGQVKCQSPPSNGGTKCNELDPSSDKDIPRPTGPKMECCPLWKCKKDDKSSSFFTFHGLNGVGPTVDGKEIVHYESTEQQGRSVSSSASGSHDSTANALSEQDMDELQKALAEAGIS